MKDRRFDILEASCRVVARRGVRGLRVDDVARNAGVSVALIYYHFQNREGLLRRVLEHANDRAGAYTQSGLPASGAPREQIEQILLREIQDDPVVAENVAVWSEINATAVFEPTLRDAVRAGTDRWQRSIEHLIVRAQADGSVSDAVDPVAAAARLTALTDGLSTRWLSGVLSAADARTLLAGAIGLELGLPGALEEITTRPRVQHRPYGLV
jgi:AcrR family transcriptional regulator